MLLFVTAVTVALVVSFLCSICEAALLSINHAQVEELDRSGRRAGRILKEFKRRIDTPIAAILIANTIAHTIGASLAGASYSRVFPPATLWLFTLLFTTAVLLFTEIIPKTAGVIHARRLAAPVAYTVSAMNLLLRPIVVVSGLISRAIRGDRDRPVTSLEEIRLLTALGRREGVVGERTAGMILGAAELGELRVGQVMVPRGKVAFLSSARSREENLALIRRSGHSRFPFSPTVELDQVEGIVLAKELHFHLLDHPEGPIAWEKLLRVPLLVPPTKPLNDLLRVFQRRRSHLAMVVNEYGGIDGIVTLEDVLEEIVGEIVDESDGPVGEFKVREDGGLVAPAGMEMRRLCRHLGVAWDPDREGVVSVGGLVARELERIPRRGDRVSWRGMSFQVLAAGRRRPETILILPAPGAEDRAREGKG